MKYEKAFTDYFSRQLVFTIGDAARYLAGMGASRAYARLFMHNLLRRKAIYRLARGTYTFHDNEAVYGFAFRPFYYGLEYALTIRRLWTQQANPVIVTTSKANQGIRRINGTNVVLRRISENAFFGFEYISYAGVYVPVATPEKILLDILYYREKMPSGVMQALIDASSKKLLDAYAARLGEAYERRVQRLFKRAPARRAFSA
ncbi:MAG: hypothetical protein QW528_03920 [Candidatus Micrarchaeaceae archaeon]